MDTHEQISELLVAYALAELPQEQAGRIKTHLGQCPQCCAEAKRLEKLLESAGEMRELTVDEQTCESAQKTLFAAVGSGREEPPTRQKLSLELIWRQIMKSRVTRLGVTAVIIIAAVLAVSIFHRSVPTASAAEILEQAVKAVSNLSSIHIKAEIRTLPRDNFSLIMLEHDFVPVELWKKVDDSGQVKWKVEKPGRVLVMDGNSTTLFISPGFVRKSGPSAYVRGYDCDWLGRLVDVKDLIESEYKCARESKDTDLVMRHETVNGREKLVLEVDSIAQGDYTNDYLKNKFLSASDHTKIYHFDAQTKLLEGFEIIVHADQNDILAVEVTDIEYNPQIDDKVFALDLPENVISFKMPEILPENEEYQKMGPKETAIAFFNACAKQDWNEFLKYWMMSQVDARIKDYLGGLEVISIGEPFKSGLYPGWFVPYEIKFKDGTIKKMNLAVRNDNSARRYVVDGGL